MLISLPGYSQEIWKDSIGKENGWKYYSSFGWFWSASRSSKEITHVEHGLLFAEGSYKDGVWLYDTKLGWVWTSETVYPNLYSKELDSWVFYAVGSKRPREFYNYSQERWIEIQQGGAHFVPGEVLVGIVNEIKELDLMRFFESRKIEWRKFHYPRTFSVWIQSGGDSAAVIAELETFDIVRWADHRGGRVLVMFNIVGSLSWSILEANRILSEMDQVEIDSDHNVSRPWVHLVTEPNYEFELINWLTDLTFVRHAELNHIVTIFGDRYPELTEGHFD